MYQDLFLHLHQTLDQIKYGLEKTEDLDEEISLLEKYLSVKEISEELTNELHKIQAKLMLFEKEHGLIEEDNTDLPEAVWAKATGETENDEVVIELDEEDFFSFQKGIGFYDLVMYDKAMIHLEKVISKYPDFNLARLYKAMAYYKKGENDPARREALILLQFSEEPNLNSLAHNILGMVYSNLKEYEEAIQHFNHAVSLNQKWEEPRFNLAMVYYKLSRFQDALLLFEKLYESNPKDWEVVFYLAKTYQKLKDDHKANEFFKKTFQITKHPEVIKQIIHYFESRKNIPQAIHWYYKWLNLEINSAVLIGLAKNIWIMGEKEKGTAIIKKALSLDRNNLEALFIYAWMLTKDHHKDALKVIAFLQQTLIRNSDIKQPLFIANLARLYYLHHDTESSERFSSMLFSSNHSSIRALGHIVQGLISLDQNLPKDALEHFEHADVQLIQFPYIDFYQGYTHYLLGNTEQAKNSWTKLIK